jgi:hypothetical protein
MSMGSLARIAAALARLAGLDDEQPADLWDHSADEWDAIAATNDERAGHSEWQAECDHSGRAPSPARCRHLAAEAREAARVARRNAALIRCGRFA